MEKYNDSSSPSHDASEFENAALLNTNYMKQEKQRQRNYIYLTLFNLFIFTLSMLSVICAVMSQKDTSSFSAAKLMDQFGLTSPAMHEIEYSRVKFTLPSPLNSSKYVGITDDVENAWMDVAYRKPLSPLPQLDPP
jgi:hypothetical protein